MFHWFEGMIWLMPDSPETEGRSLTFLATVAVALGLWRIYLMVMRRRSCGKKFYPVYFPVVLTVLAAVQYIPQVRSFPTIYPAIALPVFLGVLAVLTVLLLIRAGKYVRSFFPGGSTPPARWYKAWPLRVLHGTVPFLLTCILTSLVLVFMFRLLAVAANTSESKYALGFGRLAEGCLRLADGLVPITLVAIVVWGILLFVGLVGRKVFGRRGNGSTSHA